MEAKELRIGNLLIENNKQYKLQLADFYNMYLDDDCIFEPIPLTEEWLLKFGFENKILSSEFSITNFPFIIYNNEIWTDRDNDDDAICRVDFVHELQNFYFAVKKKELEISADALQ